MRSVDVTQIPHVLVQGIFVCAPALFEQLLVLVVEEGQIDPACRFLDAEVAAVVLERGKGAGQIGLARAVVFINSHQPIPGVVDVVLAGARVSGIRSRCHVARGVGRSCLALARLQLRIGRATEARPSQLPLRLERELLCCEHRVTENATPNHFAWPMLRDSRQLCLAGSDATNYRNARVG